MKKEYFLGISEEGFHRVAYWEWGIPSTQPPILCIHGLTRNGRDFDELAARLSRARHVLCPDIVGRGDSDWLNNPQHYTYEQYMADMNALIALTRSSAVDWVGTSMGGLLGMMLASLPNSPIRRLVLNDIGPQIPAKALARLAKYAGRDPDFHSLEAAKAHFKSIYQEFEPMTEAQWDHLTVTSVHEMSPNRYVVKVDHNVKISPSKSKIAWQWLTHPYKALEGTFFDVDLWQIWRKITCPVLVIHGERSDILSVETIQKMQHIHPATQVLTVPLAGHAPTLLDSVQQETIERFLNEG
jgi:pimeloyl-ACP methyl ester carboxylesterase